MAVSRLGSRACFSRILRIKAKSVGGRPWAASFSFHGSRTFAASVKPVPARATTVPPGWVAGCDAGCDAARAAGPVAGLVLGWVDDADCVAGAGCVAAGAVAGLRATEPGSAVGCIATRVEGVV